MEVNIWEGILISFGVISIWKLIRFKFRDKSVKPSFEHWIRDNWADYPINIAIAVIFFVFESDSIRWINKLLSDDWQIPNPENKGFLFVLIPVIVLMLLYPILRKYLSKPIQQAVNSTVDPTKPGGPKT